METPPTPETPAADPAPGQPPSPAPSEPQPERTVPYDRFKEINEQAKAAKDEVKKMSDRLAELEDRDKSEVERHRAQLEREQKERGRLTSELAQREERLTQLERGSWVRSAAQQAKFIDPEDAVVNVDLSQVENEKDAERAVKKLAERKKHLVGQGSEHPQIGQVLASGQPVDPANAQAVAQAQKQQENEEFLGQLKAASQEGWSSAPGLLDK